MNDGFPLTHCWFQLKTFLESVGFRQTPSKNSGYQDFLYFMHEKTRHTISFEKSNKINTYTVRRILHRLGFTYELFISVVYKDQNNSAS
jgi:hypothetical protein